MFAKKKKKIQFACWKTKARIQTYIRNNQAYLFMINYFRTIW